MMQFVKSRKGKEKVIFEDYVYVKQKNLANGVVSFECEKRRNKLECKAKIKLRKGMLVGRLNSHSHSPNPTGREFLDIGQEINRSAEETEEASQPIVNQFVSPLSDYAMADIPSSAAQFQMFPSSYYLFR